MRRVVAASLVALAVGAVAWGATYFRLYGVVRVERETYVADNGVVLRTRPPCDHRTEDGGEDVVLEWRSSGDHRVTWANGRQCWVWRVEAP